MAQRHCLRMNMELFTVDLGRQSLIATLILIKLPSARHYIKQSKDFVSVWYARTRHT